MKKLISKHVFGDMLLCYVLDTERGCAGLCAMPERVEIPCSCEKILACYPESEAGRLSLTGGRVVLERPEEFEGFGLLLE